MNWPVFFAVLIGLPVAGCVVAIIFAGLAFAIDWLEQACNHNRDAFMAIAACVWLLLIAAGAGWAAA